MIDKDKCFECGQEFTEDDDCIRKCLDCDKSKPVLIHYHCWNDHAAERHADVSYEEVYWSKKSQQWLTFDELEEEKRRY